MPRTHWRVAIKLTIFDFVADTVDFVAKGWTWIPSQTVLTVGLTRER